MPVIRRVVKPRTQRAKRALVRREPQLIENPKNAMFLRGSNCSQLVVDCMKDLVALKKPLATYFNRRNEIRPMEDVTPLESFGKQHDCSLFAMGSHSKKRPHNLIIGRLYDYHLLDMVELGILSHSKMSSFHINEIMTGAKPVIIFSGEAFQTEPQYQRLKNLFLDFFRGEEVTSVRLMGLEHVICITAVEAKILLRCYHVQYKKSGSETPRVELEEMGPATEWELRRMRLASDDLFKLATRMPKQLKVKKKKNLSKDVFGTQVGRIHMQRQDLAKLQTRKMKALKKGGKNKKPSDLSSETLAQPMEAE
ncbi:unnamed protein product [Darwinula stevensoni]|uniref:Ribosome production factor 2 homolog n=1 Tax=Darwinula stevensoni TaxID=69355 RepID=A0A7R8XFR1_9CRUS|nr:unnamed protein product [Darwinula stevensoni]CAG0895611.1 unnamed protein product [Darwinula stevensoni]